MTKKQLMERGKGRCCMCQKTKPLAEMTKDADRPPARCKKCSVIYLMGLLRSNPAVYQNMLRLNRQYYARNKKTLNAKRAVYQRERYRKDPEYRKYRREIDRNRTLPTSGDLFDLFQAGKGRCYVCKEIKSIAEMSKKGRQRFSNLCKICNNAKAKIRRQAKKATNE